jgi:hypothetical protein
LESPNYKDVSPDGLFQKWRIVRRALENSRAGICRLLTQADDKPDLSRLGTGENGKHSKTAILLAFLQIGGLAHVVSGVGNLFSQPGNNVSRLSDNVCQSSPFVPGLSDVVRQLSDDVSGLGNLVRKWLRIWS